MPSAQSHSHLQSQCMFNVQCYFTLSAICNGNGKQCHRYGRKSHKRRLMIVLIVNYVNSITRESRSTILTMESKSFCRRFSYVLMWSDRLQNDSIKAIESEIQWLTTEINEFSNFLIRNSEFAECSRIALGKPDTGLGNTWILQALRCSYELIWSKNVFI